MTVEEGTRRRHRRFILTCNQRGHRHGHRSNSPAPIVALIAGIAILLVPRLLNFIVAAYLIIVGVIGLGLIK
jgi:hypothetical protein